MQKKHTCGENDAGAGNTSMRDLDLPLTPASLRTLAQQGLLKPEWYEKALLFLGIRPQVSDWAVFWQRVLLLTGLLLSIAGVICFFAWNWADMSHFSKFGLIIALMLASVALPLVKGLDSTVGRLGLLACGLLAGPLLAVFGQYYQTGADAWELFRAWAVFLLLLAILGRQNGLWAAAWLIGSTAGVLYIQDNWLSRWGNSFKAVEAPEFILIQALILVAWEGAIFQARRRANSFLHASWFARVLAIWMVLILTQVMAGVITSRWFEHADSTPVLPATFLFSGLYILLLGGGYYWYRIKRPDTLILTTLLGSLIFLFFVLLFENFTLSTMGGMLLCAVLLMVCAYGAAKLVMHWHRTILQNKTEVESGDQSQTEKWSVHSLFFLKSRSLRALFDYLGHPELIKIRDASVETITNTRKAADNQFAPWYVRLMLTSSAWFSAFFLLAFLTYAIQLIGNDNRYTGYTLMLTGSVLFLVIAFFLTRKEALFRQEFGLALALAGCIGSAYALLMLLKLEKWWQLIALLTAFTGFILTRNATLRCVATFVAVFSLLDLIAQLLWSGRYYSSYHLSMHGISILFFGLSGLILAQGWLTEKNWVGSERKNMVLRPVLSGLIATFLAAGCLLMLTGSFNISRSYSRDGLFFFLLNGIGLGSGIGLCYLAWRICGGMTGMDARKMLIYSGALAAAIAGWWLPWLPVAVFMLALGRYLGSMVLVGLSALFLAVCVNWYYYSLQTSLLYKSYTLCIAGIIMLILGYLIYKAFSSSRSDVSLPDSSEGEHHA